MNALIALVLSLAAPGAGHIFNGFYTEGLVLGVLFAFGKSTFLPLILRVFGVGNLKRTLQIFYVCNWFYIALICYAALTSFWSGFSVRQTHFWYALLFAVAVSLAYRNTLNAFIFTALCGRTGVYAILRAGRKSPTETK